MLASGDGMKEVCSAMRAIVRPEMFRSFQCATLWTEMLKMLDKGVPLDTISLVDWLKQSGNIQSVGGVGEIARIIGSVPSYTHGKRYAEIIRDRWVSGEISSLCHKAQSYLLNGGSASPQDVGRRLSERLTGLIDTGAADDFVHVKDAAERFLLERRSKKAVVLPTGVRSLDEIIGGLPIGGFILVCGRPGSGKAQPLSAKILTPDGWKTMGEMSFGQEIIGADGNRHRVTGVFPQGRKTVYRVRFSDGGETACCDDHLWLTRSRQERKTGKIGSVKPLSEIRASVTHGCDNRLNHSIQYVRPVEFSAKELTIDPYLLGLYLGDGDTGSGGVQITNSEADIQSRIIESLPIGDAPTIRARKVGIRRCVKTSETSETVKHLKLMGLYRLKSPEKFIPAEYLISGTEDRLALLRGLMDTDGYVSNECGVEFSTTSSRMCQGVTFLVQSLGGRVTWKRRKAGYRKNDQWIECNDSYRMNISFHNGIIPVSSEKHLRKFKGVTRTMDRFIESVEVVEGGPVECQCISVDADDKLYVTDDFIVTHNSLLGRQIAINIAAGGDPAAIVTVEENVTKVTTGVLSNLSNVENNRVAWGDMEESEFLACEQVTTQALSNLPLWINDKPTRIEDVAQSIAHIHSKRKIKTAVVDYLQLIESEGEREDIRIGNVSRTLKNLGKSLGIPIVACCQLSRKNENEGMVRKPRMSDLRGSGTLEQDGDVIIMLHREDYYRYAEEGYQPSGIVEMMVNKSKNGPHGIALGKFEAKYQRIGEIDHPVF